MTIVLIFLVIFKAVTGFDVVRRAIGGGEATLFAGEPQFGFGFDPDSFAFEAADALRESGIEGNVLNTQLQQGDSIIWRAGPARKTFLDSRRHVFSPETIRKFEDARIALRDDEIATFRTLVDGLDVSAAMVQVADAPKTYQTMINSQNWIPFYDDGAVALFGRADSKPKDKAYFVAHRLDADRLVYKEPGAVPSTDRLPPRDRRPRQDLSVPVPEPPPAAHRGRPPMAPAGGRRRRQAVPARPRAVHHGDPRGPGSRSPGSPTTPSPIDGWRPPIASSSSKSRPWSRASPPRPRTSPRSSARTRRPACSRPGSSR